MDLIEGIGEAMINKATEQMLCHFHVGFKEGKIQENPPVPNNIVKLVPHKVGLVVLMASKEPPENCIELFQKIFKMLHDQRAINPTTKICEFHFKREFSMTEGMECFLYRVETP